MVVRVGILGAGYIARTHSQLLREVEDRIERAGAYDPDPARLHELAEESGHRRCRSAEEVLDGCDAVFVCAPTATHLPLVRAAAERGVAVYCEKPLAVDLPSARNVAAVAATVTNQVGLVLRRSPAFRALRHGLADGRFGPAMAISFRDDQHLPVRGRYDSRWRIEVDQAGGGVLLEHSVHDLDLLEWVVGPVRRVSARTANHHGHPGIEDTATVMVEHAGGELSTLASVWHEVGSRPSERRLELLAVDAVATVEHDWFGPLRIERDGEAEPEVLEGDHLLAATGDDEGWGNPTAAFVAAVADGRPAHPSLGEAVRAHELVDAAYRSAAAGGAWVETP